MGMNASTSWSAGWIWKRMIFRCAMTSWQCCITMSPQCWFYVEKTMPSRHCHNVATTLILRRENNVVTTLSQCRHNVDFTLRKQRRHDIATMSPQCCETTWSRHCHNVATMLWNNVATTLSQCRHNIVKQRRHDIVTMSPQCCETTSSQRNKYGTNLHCHNVVKQCPDNVRLNIVTTLWQCICVSRVSRIPCQFFKLTKNRLEALQTNDKVELSSNIPLISLYLSYFSRYAKVRSLFDLMYYSP